MPGKIEPFDWPKEKHMKRWSHAVILALSLGFTLLFSACAPSRNMLATLTQLPFAATPPTYTPGPTMTPRATRTATNTPPGYEATSAVLTSTYAVHLVTATATAVPTATVRAACILSAYDETAPGPDAPEQYFGKHYNLDHPPAEITVLGSGNLETDKLSWAHVRVQGQDMYWIQKVGCRDANGQPYWEIADALTLPQLNTQANEVVANLCFSGDRQFSNIIAYGTYDPTTPATPVVKNIIGWPIQIISAWQMKDRFIPISSRGLTCVFQKP